MRRLAFLALLPMTTPCRRVVLLGADDDLLQAARDAGIAESIDTKIGRPDSADLVVVLAGEQSVGDVDVVDVAREVKAGGLVWWETDRTAVGEHRRTPQRLLRRFAQHGLAVCDVHLLRPHPNRAEWYVPLAHRGALRWFSDSLHAAHTWRQLMVTVAMRAASYLGPRALGAIVPFHAVLARRTGEWNMAPAAATDGSYVHRHADHLALLSHGGDRSVLVAFVDGSPTPTFVAKVPNGLSAVGSIADENEMTNAVRRHVGAPLDSSIPRSFVNVDEHGVALVQEVMHGRSLARLIGLPERHLESKTNDLFAVTRWIGDLHSRPVDADHRWGETDIARLETELDAFAGRFALSDDESELFTRTRRLAEELRGAVVPAVWEHGDFTPWNVLRDGDDIRVVDWESTRVGWPLCDLLRFTDQWHAGLLGAVTTAERAAARAAMVCPPSDASPATRAARLAIDSYVHRLRLPPTLEAVLQVGCLAAMAVRHDDRRRRAGDMSTERRHNPPATSMAAVAASMLRNERISGGER